MAADVSLRKVIELDVVEFFAHRQARGEARPSDCASFLVRWRKSMGDPNVDARTIVVHGAIVGYISRFTRGSLPEVCYELGPEHWGKGFATAALKQFLGQIDVRPLYARATINQGRHTSW
jgi:RimJ/RimL family protein N-acetyltransferase